jgi:hypothetical protein
MAGFRFALVFEADRLGSGRGCVFAVSFGGEGRRLVIKRLLPATVALFVLAFAAAAAAGTGSSNAAVVTKTGLCGYDTPTLSLAVDDKQRVETSNGGKILVCHFTADDILVGTPSRFTESGFDCFVNGVLTNDSFFTMNDQGIALARCHVHG